jgi:hypothetical protein
MLKCEVCGHPFIPCAPNQIYCTDGCRDVAYHRRKQAKRSAQKAAGKAPGETTPTTPDPTPEEIQQRCAEIRAERERKQQDIINRRKARGLEEPIERVEITEYAADWNNINFTPR